MTGETCPNGHARTRENTYRRPVTGNLECSLCRRDAAARQAREHPRRRAAGRGRHVVTLPLFHVGDQPEPPPAPEKPRPDARRRERQAACLARGQHPLAAALRYPLLLHADAAPRDDRDAPGLRCGGCAFRQLVHWHNNTYPKCSYDGWAQATHGPGTDIRRWWPACRHYEPRVGQ